jgi:hypothetical protein
LGVPEGVFLLFFGVFLKVDMVFSWLNHGEMHGEAGQEKGLIQRLKLRQIFQIFLQGPPEAVAGQRVDDLPVRWKMR